ncbi:MAG: polyprenol monophosphomannose synthase [Chloroflexi bacterium]|nr:polyprenol monophosphomannose synthase [Chloroflexota bacterium]
MTSQAPPRRVVVIPTYNEAASIREAVAGARGAMVTDVLIVDDGSPDGTGKIADELAARSAGVAVIHRAEKSGLAGAYAAGFAFASAAGYTQIFQMDADGSHDAGALPLMAAGLEAGADLVVGSRWIAGGGVRNWPLARQAVSRAGSRYSRRLLGLPVHDATSGFKAWRADLLTSIGGGAVSSNGYVFQVEMTYLATRAGARIVEVPYVFVDRLLGESKFSGGIVLEAMLRVAALRAGQLRGTAAAIEPYQRAPALETLETIEAIERFEERRAA